MRDKKNAPEIRFKGFWEPWEENTFNNLAEYKKGPFGSSLTKSIFVPKSTNAMKVYEQQNAICKNWKLERYFITKSYANKMSSFEVRGGDIIVSCAGTIGATYILPDDAVTGIINQALMRIRVNDVIIDKKLFIYLFTNMIDDFSKIHSNGSAIKNIPPFSDLKPTKVLIPNIKEQSKLIVFLSKIDDLIKFQQQKIDKLQNIKKSMLDKMFPKNENTVPAIRFKGFSEFWEEIKLKHLCKVFTDGDWIETKDQSVFGVRLIQTGNIGINEFIDKSEKSKWISYETYQRLKCKAVLPEDILISRLPEPAGRACIVPNINHKMITAVDCTILRLLEEYNNKFVVQFLSTDNYFKKVNNFLAGGTRQRISRSTLGDFKIILPKNRLEEQQIGKFFSKIDDLIKFQQQKLEKLKNIKKSMLDKMFV